MVRASADRHGGARARAAAQRAADDPTAPSPRLGLNELRNAMRELGSTISAEALEAAFERRLASFSATRTRMCCRVRARGGEWYCTRHVGRNQQRARTRREAAAAYADREIVMVSAVSQGLDKFTKDNHWRVAELASHVVNASRGTNAAAALGTLMPIGVHRGLGRACAQWSIEQWASTVATLPTRSPRSEGLLDMWQIRRSTAP